MGVCIFLQATANALCGSRRIRGNSSR